VYTTDRSQLQSLLEGLLGTDKVYFQPPNNVAMVYPCIVYQRDYGDTMFAGNKPYVHTVRYQVTVIAKDPDNVIQSKVAQLPMCLRVQFFTANNLNHDVFTLYY
jgi:hypothetical protein